MTYGDFQIPTPAGNQFSVWQLCSSCDGAQRALPEETAETEPDPRSQLLSLLQNTEVFSGSIRLHQIEVFFQTVAWQSLDLFTVFYLLCAFLWASVQGQLETWVRRGKESINSKRAGVYYHVFRQQISLLGTYSWLGYSWWQWHIMSNYVCDFPHFFCLPGEALTAPCL